MKILVQFIFLILLANESYCQNSNFIAKPRAVNPQYLSNSDSLNISYEPSMPEIFNGNNSITQNIPYPIIFIHGLDSSRNTWNQFGSELIFRGLFFGGQIDFCLNDDNNNYSSNKLVWPTPNADISLFTDYENDLIVGDFYFINFDVDNNGNMPSADNDYFEEMLSNESAIVKQGVALRIAIQMVLAKTGRDKVILMGHSMGGLAAREYIQNPVNWASDNRHHIAKLVTTGSPHGGFNYFDLSPTVDNRSEAYRDLREYYLESDYPGVYLFGGSENETVINNNFTEDFYNIDVNCNGVSGDNTSIIGLNEKTLPANLEYSYIIGNCLDCLISGGDGVVTEYNANLSNFLINPIPFNEFIHTATPNNFLIGLHSDLPSATIVNMQALDQPMDFNLSYEVFLNKEYKGFITKQADGDFIDYDTYKINIDNSGSYYFNIQNPFGTWLYFDIYDTNFNIVSQNNLPYVSTEAITENLDANYSPYFLDFYSLADSDGATLNSYTFSVEVNTLDINDNIANDNLKLYPNPTNSIIRFDNSQTNFETLDIYNALGQTLLKINLDNSIQSNINISEFDSGVYTFKLIKEGMVKTIKVIKN